MSEGADSGTQIECYECGAPATAIYEGTVPPAGSIRRGACDEHALDVPPVRSLEVPDDEW